MVTEIIAAVSIVAVLAIALVAALLALDDEPSPAADGSLLELVDSLLPYLGLVVAAVLFGVVASVVLLG